MTAIDDAQHPTSPMGTRPRCDELDMRQLLAQLQRDMFGQDVAVELGRYRVERRLGSGAMGVVYAAHDTKLRRTVAVKVSHDDGPATAELDRTLAHEARTLGRIDHTNVVQVFDVGVADGRRYVAMEFVDGESLSEWLERGPRPWEAIRDVFLQAGRGLAAAHEAGVLHRDFKPSNVLIGRDGRVRVSDFGLARAVHHSTIEGDGESTGTTAGTPRYMAPAQLMGEPADMRSDQYSFCVALFEALFERPPFDPEDMLRSKRSREASMVNCTTFVPRGLLAAVRRGLHPDPLARFATIDALLARLRRPTRDRVRAWVFGGLALAGVGGLSMLNATAPLAHASAAPNTVSSEADDPVPNGWNEALDTARAALDVGDWDEALILSASVLEAAHGASQRAIGARAALLHGEASLKRGDLERRGEHRGALETLERGYVDAVVAADDDLQFWLAAKLTRACAQQHDLTGIDRWHTTASTALRRLEPTSRHARERSMLEAIVKRTRGDRAGALEAAHNAVELSTKPLENAASLRLLGVILFETQQFDRARETLQQGLTLLESRKTDRADGALDNATLVGLANIEIVLAGVEFELTRSKNGSPSEYGPAIARARRAVSLNARVFGPDANETTDALINLSTMLDGGGRHQKAIDVLLDTRERVERARASADDGRWAVASVVIEQSLGIAHFRLDRFEEAEAHLVRAIVLADGSLGPEHPQLMGPLGWLGKVQLRLDALDRARTTLERAEKIGLTLSQRARMPVVTMLGDLEAASDDGQAAAAHYREVAAYWREIDGYDSPTVERFEAQADAQAERADAQAERADAQAAP